MATHSGPSEENDDDDGSLTLHSVVTPSSLVIRTRALKTFLYPLRWSAGNLETNGEENACESFCVHAEQRKLLEGKQSLTVHRPSSWSAPPLLASPQMLQWLQLSYQSEPVGGAHCYSAAWRVLWHLHLYHCLKAFYRLRWFQSS